EHEPAPRPLGAHGIAVARDAGAIVHDRTTLAEHAVEERRFADVRTADDRDDGRGHAAWDSGGVQTNRRAGSRPERRSRDHTMERATGFEPATSSLGSSRST